jgi:two-component system response regulator PilR (NtrC family)
LFLDEVAELPIHMQVKLLRVIQEKAVRPIGGRAEVPVDVRILSATHKNLAKLVESAHFRQDLYYRINVIELRVPPLRERRDDIPKLVGRVLERLAADGGQPPAKLTPDALAALLAYGFPGNVRELENVLERAVALCEANTIKPDDLRLVPASAQRAAALPAEMEDDGSESPDGDGGLEGYISNLEREAIEKALLETRYNKTAAAKKLGITFRALRYKLKKLGID